ncbi:MAG: sigma 54-interacting transcriptional regulator, partial [Desulforhopalus sp.]
MSSTPTILIADKEQNGLPAFIDSLDLEFSCTIEHVRTREDLDLSLQDSVVSILVLDLDFVYGDQRFEFISSLQRRHPETLILPIIPAATPQMVKQVLELDLFYFIHKPIDPREVTAALRRAYETLPPARPKVPQSSRSRHRPFHKIIGASKPMLRLFDLIKRIAEDDLSTVLIRGESGTGKELVAKAIHAHSNRKA